MLAQKQPSSKECRKEDIFAQKYQGVQGTSSLSILTSLCRSDGLVGLITALYHSSAKRNLIVRDFGVIAHRTFKHAVVAQMDRAPAFQAGGLRDRTPSTAPAVFVPPCLFLSSRPRVVHVHGVNMRYQCLTVSIPVFQTGGVGSNPIYRSTKKIVAVKFSQPGLTDDKL